MIIFALDSKENVYSFYQVLSAFFVGENFVNLLLINGKKIIIFKKLKNTIQLVILNQMYRACIVSFVYYNIFIFS